MKDLGLIDFDRAHAIQEAAVAEVLKGGRDRLILCEHPPTFTLGRLAKEEFFLTPIPALCAQGIHVARIDRGGEVTFHGPGQCVAYPIVNLRHSAKDLKIFLTKLEEVIIDLLKYFGIVANRQKGFTGVWVGAQKIASLGIGVKQWVTYHGLALNVNTDLKFFSLIKPCGLDVQMTSMARELKGPVDLSRVKEQLIRSFQKEFQLTVVP